MLEQLLNNIKLHVVENYASINTSSELARNIRKDFLYRKLLMCLLNLQSAKDCVMSISQSWPAEDVPLSTLFLALIDSNNETDAFLLANRNAQCPYLNDLSDSLVLNRRLHG